ncbi:MAG: glycosyltransferase family 4 protein [Thaumarchaeota archaeon]|nr:glycosyltransferase family 4 protein [Nitrososphaerota archaeon]
MHKKSILMAVAKYPATYGHTTVINNLCKGLNKMGYKAAIGAFSFDAEPPDNIEKIKLSKFKLLTSGVKYLDFDIIHAHQSRVNYYLLTIKPTKPIIFHYHAASNKVQELNLQLMMALYKKRISKTICVSQKALNHLQELTGKCYATVIYNGVDTSFYNPNLPRPYKKGEPQLLFVSVLRRYKNTIMLIDSMPQLLKKYPTAHLQIVGAGEDYERLQSRIKEQNLEKNVEMTGKITDEELRLRYSSSDVYISASTNEHCPVPPFEAMACGKPLVLSELESHKEILGASQAGLSFSFSGTTNICKKIEEVYENEKSYSEHALHYAKKHDWSNICQQVASVYDGFM